MPVVRSRPLIRRRGLLALAGLVAGIGLVAAGVLYGGYYDVAATEQHLRPTFRLLEIGLRESVQRRARDIRAPAMLTQADVERGFRCFQTHCAQCHGAPGIAPAAFARGLLPVPTSLSQAQRDWRPAELFWITKYGIKMTAMPAWGHRLDDTTLWSIVAFLERLPELNAQDYRSMDREAAAYACEGPDAVGSAGPGDARRGKTALLQYGCTACHVIGGVVGPPVHVGPPLTGMAARKYIAGNLPHTQENMVRWLLAPQALRPGTAMPELGLTEADARDIAAYLAQIE